MGSGRDFQMFDPAPATAAAGAPPCRPLLITSEPELLDDVLRLAAAAGADVEVVPDATAARSAWARAPLVLVGDDRSAALARAGLRRRDGVVVVSRDLYDAGIWQRAHHVGAQHVALLPDGEPWLVARLADAADGPASRAVTVAVVGGRGGAGASTLAAALAVTAARRGEGAMLVDADPFGGGADLLFGGEHAAGLRWPDLARASGRIDGRALREGLPSVGTLGVLSWDRGDPLDLRADAMATVLHAAGRACDLVVVDLPRRFDDVTQLVLATSQVVLLVVPAEVRAAAAAARIAGQVLCLADDVRLVVRGPAPGGLDAAHMSDALGLPLAGWLKPEPQLGAALERGEMPASRGRGPLAEFCVALLADLPSPDHIGDRAGYGLSDDTDDAADVDDPDDGYDAGRRAMGWRPT